MTEYAKYHGANPKIWSVVRPDTEDGLRQILETFEIRIVADLDGQFTHNAALHVVDATGHLSNIYDIGDHKPLLNRLRGFL